MMFLDCVCERFDGAFECGDAGERVGGPCAMCSFWEKKDKSLRALDGARVRGTRRKRKKNAFSECRNTLEWFAGGAATLLRTLFFKRRRKEEKPEMELAFVCVCV